MSTQGSPFETPEPPTCAHIDSDRCWCRPKVVQECPACLGGDLPGCGYCGDAGRIERDRRQVADPGWPTVIVHRKEGES